MYGRVMKTEHLWDVQGACIASIDHIHCNQKAENPQGITAYFGDSLSMQKSFDLQIKQEAFLNPRKMGLHVSYETFISRPQS